VFRSPLLSGLQRDTSVQERVSASPGINSGEEKEYKERSIHRGADTINITKFDGSVATISNE
jgi:hypothetical protein